MSNAVFVILPDGRYSLREEGLHSDITEEEFGFKSGIILSPSDPAHLRGIWEMGLLIVMAYNPITSEQASSLLEIIRKFGEIEYVQMAIATPESEYAEDEDIESEDFVQMLESLAGSESLQESLRSPAGTHTPDNLSEARTGAHRPLRGDSRLHKTTGYYNMSPEDISPYLKTSPMIGSYNKFLVTDRGVWWWVPDDGEGNQDFDGRPAHTDVSENLDEEVLAFGYLNADPAFERQTMSLGPNEYMVPEVFLEGGSTEEDVVSKIRESYPDLENIYVDFDLKNIDDVLSKEPMGGGFRWVVGGRYFEEELEVIRDSLTTQVSNLNYTAKFLVTADGVYFWQGSMGLPAKGGVHHDDVAEALFGEEWIDNYTLVPNMGVYIPHGIVAYESVDDETYEGIDLHSSMIEFYEELPPEGNLLNEMVNAVVSRISGNSVQQVVDLTTEKVYVMSGNGDWVYIKSFDGRGVESIKKQAQDSFVVDVHFDLILSPSVTVPVELHKGTPPTNSYFILVGDEFWWWNTKYKAFMITPSKLMPFIAHFFGGNEGDLHVEGVYEGHYRERDLKEVSLFLPLRERLETPLIDKIVSAFPDAELIRGGGDELSVADYLGGVPNFIFVIAPDGQIAQREYTSEGLGLHSSLAQQVGASGSEDEITKDGFGYVRGVVEGGMFMAIPGVMAPFSDPQRREIGNVLSSIDISQIDTFLIEDDRGEYDPQDFGVTTTASLSKEGQVYKNVFPNSSEDWKFVYDGQHVYFFDYNTLHNDVVMNYLDSSYFAMDAIGFAEKSMDGGYNIEVTGELLEGLSSSETSQIFEALSNVFGGQGFQVSSITLYDYEETYYRDENGNWDVIKQSSLKRGAVERFGSEDLFIDPPVEWGHYKFIGANDSIYIWEMEEGGQPHHDAIIPTVKDLEGLEEYSYFYTGVTSMIYYAVSAGSADDPSDQDILRVIESFPDAHFLFWFGGKKLAYDLRDFWSLEDSIVDYDVAMEEVMQYPKQSSLKRSMDESEFDNLMTPPQIGNDAMLITDEFDSVPEGTMGIISGKVRIDGVTFYIFSPSADTDRQIYVQDYQVEPFPPDDPMEGLYTSSKTAGPYIDELNYLRFENDDLGNNHRFVISPEGEVYSWPKDVENAEFGRALLALMNDGSSFDDLDEFDRVDWTDLAGEDTKDIYTMDGWVFGNTSSGGFVIINARVEMSEDQIESMKDMVQANNFSSIVFHEVGTRNYFKNPQDLFRYLNSR